MHFKPFQSTPDHRALPAGLTCLKEAAAGMPKASLSSFTSCQAFKASHKFINPGAPFRTTHKNIYTLISRINKVRYTYISEKIKTYLSTMHKLVLSEVQVRGKHIHGHKRSWWEKWTKHWSPSPPYQNKTETNPPPHTHLHTHTTGGPNPANLEINQENSGMRERMTR